MRIIESLKEMTETARGWLAAGTVGFVLIKGELHEGHMMLIQEAQKACEISVVGLLGLCWPFATNEERRDYQLHLEQKLQQLSSFQNLVVFVPHFEEVYSATFRTLVLPTGVLLDQLNEDDREYIRSILTLTIKMFHLVRPDVIYLGRKDAQQIAVLRQTVRDLNIDVHLRIMPTLREKDGLALSIRNQKLSEAERQVAELIYPALQAARALIMAGERSSAVIAQEMRHHLQRNPLLSLEFAGVYAADTFLPVAEVTPDAILAIAVRIGTVQLVDALLWEENA